MKASELITHLETLMQEQLADPEIAEYTKTQGRVSLVCWFHFKGVYVRSDEYFANRERYKGLKLFYISFTMP